ncbi:hypothetical protein [Streptomyces sp. RerS4]|uniref:hypothetical protein n=1 Tax=Streptomyces sp. RerS4 TaxID=2942449 RepID=UPI00201C088C|nr:hypothetical protein [Streptomyces sp. RerS4]UQX00318.1 hypothetical protein M4D82_06990 [Streptomyces sp. RerS4]
MGGVRRGPGRLRLPLVAAVLVGQLPLSLAAAASGSDAVEGGWALLATAALDAALAVAVSRRAVRVPAWAAAGLLGGRPCWWGSGPRWRRPRGGAALGVAVAWREPKAWRRRWWGLAAVAAVGAAAPADLGPGWGVALRVVAASALLVLVRAAGVRAAGVPEPVRRGLLWAGVGVAALAAVTGLAGTAVLLVTRLRVLGEVWAATTPAPARELPVAALAVTLLLTAGAGWCVARSLPGRREPVAVASAVAVVCAWAGLFVAPMAAVMPTAVVLGAQLGVTAALGALALRTPARAAVGIAAGCAPRSGP